MKIQVTYEFPPGPGQREIRSRLESLEKNNLSEEEKLEKEELINSLEPRQLARVTVRQCSYLDRTHYFHILEEGRGWYREKTGKQVEEEPGDFEEASLRTFIYFRSELLCSVPREKFPRGTVYFLERCSKVYGSEEEKWEKDSFPEEWVDINLMSEEFPVEFFDNLVSSSRSLNAGVLPSVPDFFRESSVRMKEI